MQQTAKTTTTRTTTRTTTFGLATGNGRKRGAFSPDLCHVWPYPVLISGMILATATTVDAPRRMLEVLQSLPGHSQIKTKVDSICALRRQLTHVSSERASSATPSGKVVFAVKMISSHKPESRRRSSHKLLLFGNVCFPVTLAFVCILQATLAFRKLLLHFENHLCILKVTPAICALLHFGHFCILICSAWWRLILSVAYRLNVPASKPRSLPASQPLSLPALQHLSIPTPQFEDVQRLQRRHPNKVFVMTPLDFCVLEFLYFVTSAF